MGGGQTADLDSDLAETPPDGGGTPSAEVPIPPWLAQLSHLRSQQPDAHPHTLALELDAKHGIKTTGKAIRDLEAWIKAQPVEEW